MRWLDRLLGIDKLGIPALKAEVDALRNEVAALERRDYLLQKIEHLEQRLAAMDELRNAAPIAPQAQLQPTKKMWWLERWLESAWAHFEVQVTETVVRWVFFTFVLLILLPAVPLWREAPAGRDLPEYLSYVFPIAAAIAAGLAAYREDRKGRYFIGSLFLLFMGVDAFIASHPRQVKAVLALNGIVAVAMFTLFLIGTIRSAFKAWDAEGQKGKVARIASALGVVVANLAFCSIGIFAVQYASAIYVRDRPCLTSDPKAQSLCPPSIYPHLDEIFHLNTTSS